MKERRKEKLEKGLPLLDLCILGIIEAPLRFGHKKARRYEGSQSESESLSVTDRLSTTSITDIMDIRVNLVNLVNHG